MSTPGRIEPEEEEGSRSGGGAIDRRAFIAASIAACTALPAMAEDRPAAPPQPRPRMVLSFMQGALPDKVTVARSTPAGYFDAEGCYRIAPPNTWRNDFDPATGENRGMLIEAEHRTQLQLHSRQMTPGLAGWSTVEHGTVTTDAADFFGRRVSRVEAVARDGQPLGCTGGATFPGGRTAGKMVTISFWARNDGGTGRSFRLAVTERGGNCPERTVQYEDEFHGGKFRHCCRFTVRDDGRTALTYSLRARLDGRFDFHCGLFQVEEGAWPSMWIEATQHPVRRDGDRVAVEGIGGHGRGGGTVLLDGEVLFSGTGADIPLLSVEAASGEDGLRLVYAGSMGDEAILLVPSGAGRADAHADAVLTTGAALVPDTRFRIAVACSTGQRCSLVRDGSAVARAETGPLSAVGRLSLGGDCRVREIAYDDRALDDRALVELTRTDRAGYVLVRDWNFGRNVRTEDALFGSFLTRHAGSAGNLDYLNAEWSRAREDGKTFHEIDGDMLRLWVRLDPALVRDAQLTAGGANGRIYYGMLRSVFRQRFGFFAARLRLPKVAGMWPAFWLYPADFVGPAEIDVLEIWQNQAGRAGDTTSRPYLSVHGPANGRIGNLAPGAVAHTEGRHSYITINTVDLAGEFHVFACEWTPELVSFLIDDQRIGTIAFRWLRDDLTPAAPANVIIGCPVGSAAPSGPPTRIGNFPFSLDIDWIRIYAKV